MSTTKDIVQTVSFDAPAKDVYNAFMDEDKHAKFTGYPASIENKVGGSFNVSGDYATGKNIELKPGRKVVQTWRASDWPDRVESTLTLDLSEKNGVTTLKLTQKGIPKEHAKDISDGWHEYYWQPLKEYLEK